MKLDGSATSGDGANAAARDDRVAVVDIGSNSIRLVVYEGPARTPFPVFNEKSICALGSGLAASGVLNPDGVQMALRCLTRFAKLAEVMNVRSIDLLATAAVRDARDGPEFANEVQRLFGEPVKVLSGEAEARLAGIGVISGRPDADGLMGDLGGGSLDLVMFNAGTFGDSATLSLGALRLLEESGGKRERAIELVDERLKSLDWLSKTKGRNLYPIGGAWRALARIAINQSGYPLHVLDGFELSLSEGIEISHLIAGLSRKTLESIPRLSPRRIETLPMAAMLMERLLAIAEPSKLVFSVYGMREGQYFENLAPEVRNADPLISACDALGRQRRRFRVEGLDLLRWMTPLFPGEAPDKFRLRHAAALLGDVAWMEHPDYRPESAFRRVLRSPFTGVTHAERVALAYAICARHGGDDGLPTVWRHRSLLSEEDAKWAQIVGRALRLAFTLSGGVPELLNRTALRLESNSVTLLLPEESDIYWSEAVERRFKSLGRALGVEAVMGQLEKHPE